MEVALGFTAGVIVSGLVVAGVVIWRRRRPSAPPQDPVDDVLAMIADLTAAVLDLTERAPRMTAGERLTRVDELRAADLIDGDEHARVRSRILADHDEHTDEREDR